MSACFIGTRANFANGSARTSFFAARIAIRLIDPFSILQAKWTYRVSASTSSEISPSSFRNAETEKKQLSLAGSRVQWDRAPRAHLAISRHENLSFVYAWYRLTHTYKECCVFSNMLSLLQAMSSTSRVFGVKGRERGNERFSEWKSLRGFWDLSNTSSDDSRVARDSTNHAMKILLSMRRKEEWEEEEEHRSTSVERCSVLWLLGFLRQRASLNSHWACSSFRRGTKVTRFACTRFFLFSLSLSFSRFLCFSPRSNISHPRVSMPLRLVTTRLRRQKLQPWDVRKDVQREQWLYPFCIRAMAVLLDESWRVS